MKSTQSKEFFKEFINKHKSTLSELSKLQYINTLSTLLPEVTSDAELKKALSHENVLAIIKSIDEKYSNAQSRGFKYNSLIAVMKPILGETNKTYLHISELRDACNKTYQNRNLKHELTEKEQTNAVTTEEYDNLLSEHRQQIQELMKKDKLTKAEFNQIQQYFIVLIYFTQILRLDLTPVDIVFTKALPTDTSKNYLHVYQGRISLVLNSYKTSKTYGSKVYDFQNPLKNELKTYVDFLIRYNGRKQGLRLFSNTGNSGYISPTNLSTQMFSNFFKSNLGKAFTVTDNRKRLISGNSDVQEYQELSKKVQDVADQAGHSVKTMEAVYVKPALETKQKTKQKSKRAKKGQ
jgi:hypothetical protein